MSNLIDCVEYVNGLYNVKLIGNDDKVKVLTFSDIKSMVQLYRDVYAELHSSHCDKFVHQLKADEIEEIMSSEDGLFVGYFKGGKELAGTIYAKPFDKSSPYFQTPSFEGNATSYAIGGLAVHPKFRGNGVVGKMAAVAVDGLKEYANDSEGKVAGAGFEISCENFGSLLSLGGAKNGNMENIFNFAGIHYLSDTEAKDKDLTVLGYTSFVQTPESPLYLPTATLDGSQSKAFHSLTGVMGEMESDYGVDKTEIDGHTVEMLSTYVDAPIKNVINYDPTFTTCYPPHIEQ